jgi:phosphoserine phosphatase RsbU/P
MSSSASPADHRAPSHRYDRAACGLIATNRNGLIVDINQTMLDWLRAERHELVGRKRFIDLLTGGGRIYHETHYAPLLAMQGWAREIAFDLVIADGSRLPALVNARIDGHSNSDIVDIAVFAATERRMYEQELLIAKQQAEKSDLRARLLARTLQDTLLPRDTPTVPGLEVAAIYLPAGEGHEIGGDFYDVFQITPGDWVIALGDVEGKGVDAAIVTSLVRHTIRAASVEHDPSGVLHIVNRVLIAGDSPRYCTAIVLRCRQHDERTWTITIGSGGHPLPVIATADSTRLAGTHGTLLGFLDDVTFTDVMITLEPSTVLIAYTDGITEARRNGIELGHDVVGSTARALITEPAQHILDAIVSVTLDYGGIPNADDIAAIAIRTSP